MGDKLLVQRADHDRVAILTLNSPENRNALSQRLVTDLRAHLEAITVDESLHAVLVRSAGPTFCSGADLREATSVDMVRIGTTIVAVQRAIAALPVPVVVRLDGPVRAGGLGLVAAADVVVCSADADFALTEVRLGLAAAVISIPVVARIDPRAASDWFLTGRRFGAEEARMHGLVTRVAPAEAMDDAVDAVLNDLRAGVRQGLVAAKRILTAPLVAALDARGHEMAETSGRLFHSPVAQEKMAAVLGADRSSR
ncbi:MAG: enoyl-CoA hydratase-related protein [Dermatophilaceae bacterium]